MKNKIIIGLTLASTLGLFVGCASEEHEHAHKQEKQVKLAAKAKVSKEQAQQIALAKVPNGAVKEGEIEKEHGKLIWSFDIATPDSKDITEVNVDANTGDIVAVDKESAESEAKEAASEKEKDDKD